MLMQSGKGPVQQRIDQNVQQRKIKEEPSIENVKPVYVEKKEVVVWKALPDGTKREVDAGRSKTVEQAEDELRLFDLDSRCVQVNICVIT